MRAISLKLIALTYILACKNGIVQQHFGSWDFTFGENFMVLKLSPEGTGHRVKIKRFYPVPKHYEYSIFVKRTVIRHGRESVFFVRWDWVYVRMNLEKCFLE